MHWLAIAVGGAIGSVLRYWMSISVQGMLGRGFPYGTLAVNVLGCIAMGLLSSWLATRLDLPLAVRLGLLTGVLGGFTTFSAFSLETLTLLESGAVGRAMAYVGLSLVLCVAGAWGGAILGRQL